MVKEMNHVGGELHNGFEVTTYGRFWVAPEAVRETRHALGLTRINL